jgi:cbb3-type cytochrome oxidase subunit 3
MTRTKLVLLAAALALALPDAARACSMCVSAQDDAVQTAFAVASLFMTAMPLSVIGGLVWWLRRRAKQVAAEEAAGIIRLPLGADRPKPRD